MSIIIGIDPGKSGAIAVSDGNGKLLEVRDLPMIEIVVSGKKRKQFSPALFSGWLDLGTGAHRDGFKVFLEHVSSRPGEGAVGAFSFGRGFGQIEGVLAAMQVPYTLVRPAVWKAKLKVPADKGATVQIATRLFPTHASSFYGPKGGVLDGRAEAALIALYGSQS